MRFFTFDKTSKADFYWKKLDAASDFKINISKLVKKIDAGLKLNYGNLSSHFVELNAAVKMLNRSFILPHEFISL